MPPPRPPVSADYSIITELPGNRAHAEQLSMIHTRYKWAGDQSAGKEVLEVACGPGRGLGYLASRAKSVAGGDITPSLVAAAQRHYEGRIPVSVFDAQALPFPDASFDLVLLFEALYYLPDAPRFLAEARRVLRPGGRLLLSAPNPEWADFNPSPFSVRYYDADELRALLDAAGFNAEISAAFPAAAGGAGAKAVSALRRAAVSLGIVPKSMGGKAWLKRLFYGRLAELAAEIDTSAPTAPLVPVPPGRMDGYKMLYATALRP